MNQAERIQILLAACLLMVGVVLAQQHALAAPAARVEFAVGNPQIASAGGAARPLAKGAAVGARDTVSTNDGRAYQIKATLPQTRDAQPSNLPAIGSAMLIQTGSR